MNINKHYEWEIGLTDGQVIKNKRLGFDPKSVNRVTLIPRKANLPFHEFKFKDNFIKMFGRGFLKQKLGFQLSEYLHCVVTDSYKIWVHSTTGGTLITDTDEEVYL